MEVRKSRHRGIVDWVCITLSAAAMVICVTQLFNIPIFGRIMSGPAYYYSLMGLFIPMFFLTRRATKTIGVRLPWYDVAAAILVCVSCLYLFLHSIDIIQKGWDLRPPLLALIASSVIMLVVLEGGRRVGGLALFVITVFFAFYPLFAEQMPRLIQGVTYPLDRLIGLHVMSDQSMLGLPMSVVASQIIGYMIFGVALYVTGGGKFFYDFALAFAGSTRGGAAKVSIVASSLFGMISGSAAANVLTVGTMTIPAMKRAGYSPEFAGGIEAVASTGGVLMPPIMGAAAFIMAAFLSVPYSEIVIVAIVPSILYYSGLFVQVDAHAARKGLKGIPREQLVPLRQTLKAGWFYGFVVALLVYLLLYQKLTVQAPFYSTAALLVLTNINRRTRLTTTMVLDILEELGKVLAELTVLLVFIGLIIGSLTITGAAQAFTYEILEVCRGNVALLVLLGAGVNLILGMGMSVTACYVLVAVLFAPALIAAGINPFAAHLYCLYFGMASYITPPFCPGAIIAAGLAKGNVMKTALQAMRLGLAIYLVPLFFVIDPALILKGSPLGELLSISTCFLGLVLVGGGLERYTLGMGVLRWREAVMLMVAGPLLMYPAWQADIIGLGTFGMALAIRRLVPAKKGAISLETGVRQ